MGCYFFVFTLVLGWSPLLIAQVPRVSLPTELFVYEDDGNVYVCVTLESTFTTVTNITVIMSTTDGTAIERSDYFGGVFDFVFAAGSSNGDRQCLDILIIDNVSNEKDEYFTVLLNTSDSESVVALGNDVTIITILDLEIALHLTQCNILIHETRLGIYGDTLLNVAEDEGTVDVCVHFIDEINGDVSNDVISFITNDSTAMNGSDYIGVSTDLAFPTDGTDQCVTIVIIDSRIEEPNRIFSVIVTSSVSLEKLIVNVTILDKDIITISVPPAFNVSEDVGAVQVCAILNVNNQVNFTVTLTTSDGTAMDGSDYRGVSIDLVFTAGISNGTMQCVDVDITNTSTVEEDEYFIVTLTTSSSLITLGNNVTTITIMDRSMDLEFQEDNAITMILAIGISAAIAFLFVFIITPILAVIMTLYRRHRKTDDKNSQGSIPDVVMPASLQLSHNDSSSELFHMRVRSMYRVKVPKTLIIDSCNLKLNESVGQGEFGIVYKAKFSRGGFGTTMSEVVAVKTLKGFLDDSIVSDLLKECTRMSTLDHPNVLTLIGVCLDGGPAPYIVMPFMVNGSLHSHLKKERDNLVINPNKEVDVDTASTSSKLIDMSLQIAKGMEYLIGEKLIHRDLATRNCMIDTNFIIKVSDFGLSETIDSFEDYFRQDMDTIKLPVKWLAPESLSDGIFSAKTDVWAFGVTCWEIFSGGKAPYPGINPRDLPQMLEGGYRMEKPSNAACTDDMSNLMSQCWRENAEDRPTFSDIATCLAHHLQSHAGYLTLNLD